MRRLTRIRSAAIRHTRILLAGIRHTRIRRAAIWLAAIWLAAIRLAAIPLTVLSLACAGHAPSGPAPRPGSGRPILFVGNSLTAWNSLPAMLEALADSAGGERLAADAVWFPDFALSDHWFEGSALRAIRRGGWEYVVLQQGPSSLPANRDSLRMFAARFAEEIVKAGARPALYMVWPSASRTGDFDRASESYVLAAQDVDGLLLPVAEAWRAAWRRDESLPLYGADGLHPSPIGSYLAALVMYGKLTGRSPVGLPARIQLRSGGVLEVPAAVATLLQEAAAEANARFGQ